MLESSRNAWIQSRFSFKSGASGEIRTLKHLFLRQAAIPIRARWHWCTGEDLNLRVPLGETGLQPVRFGRAHAPVQTWRKVEESIRSNRTDSISEALVAAELEAYGIMPELPAPLTRETC